MKQIYHSSNSPSSSHSPNGRGVPQGQTAARQRTGSSAEAPSRYARKRTTTNLRRNQRHNSEFSETNLTAPHKSSTSSECIQTRTPSVQAKGVFMAPLVRQNSTSIGTDHSGAAVRTINNILTGITHSVNRLTKFQPAPKETKTSKKFPNKEVYPSEIGFDYRESSRHIETKHSARETHEGDVCSHQLIGVRDVVLDKVGNTTGKPKARWSRHTSAKITPNKIQTITNMNKITKPPLKQVDAVIKARPIKTPMIAEIESHLVLQPRKRKRAIKRFKQASRSSLQHKISETLNTVPIEHFTSSNLVELYHNIAAKSSDSDSAVGSKSVIRQKGGGDLPVPPIQVAPIVSVPTNLTEILPIKQASYKQNLTTIDENQHSPENIIANNCNLCLMKNYELPTIASRMKQVNKQFLSSFSFRSIPFCPAKSITPSHNIGINIQQVMNILKTRQPVTGISPTLAHNISLAAGKLESRHLSTLVSTLSSKLGYGKSQCPLLKVTTNQTFLPILERGIPEEPCEATTALQEENISINGPCGDREDVIQQAVWTLDPEKSKRCTCLPRKGVPFQQVLRKYQGGQTEVGSKFAIKPARLLVAKSVRSYKALVTPKKQRVRNWIKNDVQRVVAENNEFTGKEKNLKLVLNNLHDEFEALNMKYENLMKDVISDDSREKTTKELEAMENELNKKEEEINMVMSLYKEVLALKDQVKKLKVKASHPSFSNLPYGSSTEFKEPQTAQHLTQLLKQIQNYQRHYKK